MKNEDVCKTFGNKTTKTASGMNQFRVLRSPKVEKMVSFGNFALIASLCMSFDLGALHGYVLHKNFLLSLKFPLEHRTKICLNAWSVSIVGL